MKQYKTPHFIIKKNLQKSVQTGVLFIDQLSDDVLIDICIKITDQSNYTVDYVDNDYQDEFFEKTYNKGRLAILFYEDIANYISFSEKEIGGRNSSVQSVPTAFNLFYLNPYKKKRLYYYFLNFNGNAATDYQIMMYRLMKTIGFIFLNVDTTIQSRISVFTSLDDIMNAKRSNTGKNKSNNASYITKSSSCNYDIYGKTYGANKYDTSMTCYALSMLAKENQNITLYEVVEKDLKELPESSINVLKKMNNIKIIPTNIQLEKKVFQENNSLRSPRYIFNLLERLGAKKCALCDCEIPELIQGAHVWPVANIKKAPISDEEKLRCATDGENGIWLCENHHTLFDENILLVNKDLTFSIENSIKDSDVDFINKITTHKQLPDFYKSIQFTKYIENRNKEIDTA